MPKSLLWCAAALSAIVTCHASAQNGDGQSLPDAELRRLVQQLDAEDPAARETATEVLATDPGLTLRRLEVFLSDASLSREQRRRLVGAAYQRFRQNPRAALGVSFEPLVRESGVRINLVVPNFPSAGVLRSGDRILSFDGIPVRDQQHAVSIIVSRDPGEEMTISLIRDGEALTLAVPLGRRDLLDNPVPVAGPMLADAWAVRSKDYASEGEPVVIDPGVGPDAWLDSATPPLHMPVSVVAGGEARGGAEPGLGRDHGRAALDATLIRPQEGLRAFPPRVPGHENLMIQRRLLRDQIEILQAEINTQRELLRRPSIPADAKREMQLQIQVRQEQVRNLELLLRRVETDMGGVPR